MSRIFAYCRVSTTEQTTANQVQAIRAAGYDVAENRVIEETISGSAHAMQRKEFKLMVEHKMEAGDVLVVLKVDRLGRDAIDVLSTVERLKSKQIKVICLDLPEPDLSSAQGKLMLGLFSVFAEWERNKIIERTNDGLARARAQGKILGRPVATKTAKRVQELKEQGYTQSQAAKELGMSIRTVSRHWQQ